MEARVRSVTESDLRNIKDCESSPLISLISSQNGGGVKLKVYKRRWYILLLFCLFSFSQAALWNTFGPISTTSEEAFGWTDATIAWLSNWGGVALVLTALPYFWLMQVKGLRWAVVSCSFFLLLGTSLRVIISKPGHNAILIHVGQFILNLAGSISMGASPSVSSAWFPPTERVTATAISWSAGYLGVAVSYIAGPLFVERGLLQDDVLLGNSSLRDNNSQRSDEMLDQLNITGMSIQSGHRCVSEACIQRAQYNIMQYLRLEVVWCAALFLAIVCYFPDAPPSPPSISAKIERQDYWSGLRSLLRNKPFLTIALVYGISVGVYGSWTSVLNVNLRHVGLHEDKSAWIGFYLTLSSCICSVLVGKFAGQFTKYLRFFIFVLYVLATTCFAVVSLEIQGILSPKSAVLYSTIIAGGSLLIAATPLMCELVCELAYPASEISANGMLAFLNKLVGIFFMIPFAFPSVGTMWMNWCLMCSCLVCIPFIAFMDGQFNRLELDQLADEKMLPAVDGPINERMVNSTKDRSCSIHSWWGRKGGQHWLSSSCDDKTSPVHNHTCSVNSSYGSERTTAYGSVSLLRQLV